MNRSSLRRSSSPTAGRTGVSTSSSRRRPTTALRGRPEVDEAGHFATTPPRGAVIRSACLFDLPLAVFAASVVISGRAAHDLASAREATIWLVAYALLALAIGWLARSRGIWRACVVIAVASGAATATLFATQYSGLSVESKIASIDAIGRWLSRPFPQGRFWLPFSNSVGTWLEGLFLLGIGAAADHRFRRLRLPLAVMSSLIGLGLLLSMSRGAWLGVAAGAAVAAATAWFPGRWRGAAGGSATMVTLAAGLVMTFDAGIVSVSRLSTAFGGVLARPDRIDIYRSSATLLDAIGLTGLGPGGQFAHPFSRFALIIQVPFVTYPHHLSLHLWLAFGVLGVTAWAWWVGALASAIVAAERYQASPAFRGAWAGMIAVLAHGITDARQAVDVWTWGPLFVLGGLIVARCRRVEDRPRTGRFALSWASLCAVGLLAVSRHLPLSAAWYSSVGHQLEARCLFGSPVADREAECRLAVDAYRHAVEEDADHAPARRRLAMAAAERGAYADALTHANVALSADPDSLSTRKVAGLVAAWAGEFRLATTLLRTVPGSSEELRVWSRALEERGQVQAAQNARDVALALQERVPSRLPSGTE